MPLFAQTLRRQRHKSQRGAAAIEFVMLFVLFFALFYALVSYAIVMLMQSAFVHAAEEGARAAIAVDRLAFSSDAAYLNGGVDPRVRTTVGTALAWMPAKSKTKVLGVNNSLVQLSMAGNLLTVRVVYADYASDPLIPMLSLPLIGQIPKVPDDLAGTAVIEL
ncbi:hypothetical protein MTYP_01677 [Methylophilaceae bacterium]|nr:hypothetical protein MTYP_01677 [Methylophilaceae bacterium]